MSSSGRHFCTVCRSWYRSWPMHATSGKHMGNVRRQALPAGSRKGIRGSSSITYHATGKNRIRQGEDMVKVDDYYRNPPTPPWAASIKDRVWYVRDYWRRRPYVAQPRNGPRSKSGSVRKFARAARSIGRARGWL